MKRSNDALIRCCSAQLWREEVLMMDLKHVRFVTRESWLRPSQRLPLLSFGALSTTQLHPVDHKTNRLLPYCTYKPFDCALCYARVGIDILLTSSTSTHVDFGATNILESTAGLWNPRFSDCHCRHYYIALGSPTIIIFT